MSDFKSGLVIYLLGETLADYDEHFQICGFHHLKLVERESAARS